MDKRKGMPAKWLGAIGWAVHVPAMIVWALTLGWLWSWFFVPLGYNPLSWHTAMGLIIVKWFLWLPASSSNDEIPTDYDDQIKCLAGLVFVKFIHPAEALCFGYLWHILLTWR